MNGRL
jgi:hypothetical protein